MKLYYFPGSCALADQTVLEWTGAPYEAVRLDRAATKSPEFLELNPSGAVPVLVDGDFIRIPRQPVSLPPRRARTFASISSWSTTDCAAVTGSSIPDRSPIPTCS